MADLSFHESVRAEIERRARDEMRWMVGAYTVLSPAEHTVFDISVRREIQRRAQELLGWLAGALSLLSNNPAGYDAAIATIQMRLTNIMNANLQTTTFTQALNPVNGTLIAEVAALVAAGIQDA